MQGSISGRFLISLRVRSNDVVSWCFSISANFATPLWLLSGMTSVNCSCVGKEAGGVAVAPLLAKYAPQLLPSFLGHDAVAEEVYQFTLKCLAAARWPGEIACASSTDAMDANVLLKVALAYFGDGETSGGLNSVKFFHTGATRLPIY
jgi:hypothetical protein